MDQPPRGSQMQLNLGDVNILHGECAPHFSDCGSIGHKTRRNACHGGSSTMY